MTSHGQSIKDKIVIFQEPSISHKTDHDTPDRSTQILEEGQHKHHPKKGLEPTLNASTIASTAVLILDYVVYFFTL